MATATEDTDLHSRLLSLVYDFGTKVLQNFLDQKLPVATLKKLLEYDKEEGGSLKLEERLTEKQFELLYPPTGQSPNIKEFDIALIFYLMMERSPQPTYLPVELCHIKRLWKEIICTAPTAVKQEYFSEKFAKIKQVLLKLNTYLQNAIPDLEQTIDSKCWSNEQSNTWKKECDKLQRNKRLKTLFKSKDHIKGKPKQLTDQNIKDLMDSSLKQYEGRYSDIYVSKDEIPGLSMKIALKKVKLVYDDDGKMLTSKTSEMLCALLVHFAVVPLFGYGEDSNKTCFYLLSPYMKNGNLREVIEEDNTRLKNKHEPELRVFDRIRILFQIASALHFMHTPRKDIRGIIIHGDIKSLNIVLDEAYNARLIDFGVGLELPEGQDQTTIKKYQFTFGYDKKLNQYIIGTLDDYRGFGVVVRELLTGQKPYVEDGDNLQDKSNKKITKELLAMWQDLLKECEKQKCEIKECVTSKLVKLSEKCIRGEDISAYKIEEKLKKILSQKNIDRWGAKVNSYLPKKCQMCLEDDPVQRETLTHSINCKNNMSVCVSCMRKSFCNPIHCHSCDTTISPEIGHGWAALLIAGDHSESNVATAFKKDVDAVFEVITNPYIIGVSVDNVQIVRPEENVDKRIQDVVEVLRKANEIQTLFVYISSHFSKDNGFELNSLEKTYLSISRLQKIITSVLAESTCSKKRTVVLLDCCYAPPIDRKLLKQAITNIRIVQLNSCREEETTVVQDGFTKFFLQCLTMRAFDEQCVNCDRECSASLTGDFATVGNVKAYINLHLPYSRRCVSNDYNADSDDDKIAYSVHFKVDIQITYEYKREIETKRIQDKVSLRMFGQLGSTLVKLQKTLFDRYIEKMEHGDGIELSSTNFYEILCIEVNRGPKKHRLTTMKMILSAFITSRELVVTLKSLHDVIDGPVGTFLPFDQTVESILSFLQKGNSNWTVCEDDNATTIIINLYDDLKTFDRFMKMVDDESKAPDDERTKTFEFFYFQLCDLEIAFKEDKCEKSLRELQIVFPCANVKGQRTYRKDFLCYKVVHEE